MFQKFIQAVIDLKYTLIYKTPNVQYQFILMDWIMKVYMVIQINLKLKGIV